MALLEHTAPTNITSREHGEGSVSPACLNSHLHLPITAHRSLWHSDIAPLPLPALSGFHDSAYSCGSPCITLQGQPVPSAPALNCAGALAHPMTWESPSARCHMDPMASCWPQALLTYLLCPQGVYGQHQKTPRESSDTLHVPNSPALLWGTEKRQGRAGAETGRDAGTP